MLSLRFVQLRHALLRVRVKACSLAAARMEILFVSAEVAPFSKTGAVADVVGALPKALRALGHRVHVLSLRYGFVDPVSSSLARRLTRLQVPLGDETVSAEVFEARSPSGVQVTLLNAAGLTDRARVMGEPDDARRMAFLCRGAVEWMRLQSRAPDVVHAHDWPAGLVPLFLRAAAESDPKLAHVRSVFTVHHLAEQGVFPKSALAGAGVPEKYFTPEGLEFYGDASWLKAGVVFADRVTTVSPTYAREITAPGGGERFEGVLRARGKDVVGILSGVDFAVWNPATDPHLVARFDAEDTGPKARCKSDLVMRTGLIAHPEAPLFGYVGQFDRSKGFELVVDSAPRWVRQDVQLVLLGQGEGPLTDAALDLVKRFPDRVAVHAGFDEALAHKIYAGADFVLVPSRFEPSGLPALYGMRYGAVPVARTTGGLKDVVLDCDPALETGTGFLFEHSDADEFFGAMARAVSAFQRPDALARLRRRVMRKDVSWERSARQYQSVYASLVGASESTHPGA